MVLQRIESKRHTEYLNMILGISSLAWKYDFLYGGISDLMTLERTLLEKITSVHIRD